ncbi:MAG: NFACT family protein [Oscillospiraceae bacterium]|jgi:predicted ribosome quality control (RQC) complex YloA/Tae2 family protein|nr:NFACT family protein [Oscillospiraceae bacterium]
MQDGIFITLLARELNRTLAGTHIEKIFQPSKEELCFVLSKRGFSGRLLLSARQGAARIHITQTAPQNPASPPMFCMLLRKYLAKSKITAFTQLGLDRVLTLELDTQSELGESARLFLTLELFGAKSNIILMNHDGRIIDAVKRTGGADSPGRLILPGAVYQPPASPARLDVRSLSNAELERLFPDEITGDGAFSALSETLAGFSPAVCRVLARKAENGLPLSQVLAEHISLISQDGQPMLLQTESGEPIDFSYFPLPPREPGQRALPCPGYSALLDSFYAGQEAAIRKKAKAADILRCVNTSRERVAKKLQSQRGELAACGDREKHRIFGELITANLWRVEKGAPVLDAEDYYNGNQPVRIPLDPLLTPAQNAERHFRRYKKLQTAQEFLTRLIADGERELEYLESVLALLEHTDTQEGMDEIREELAAQRYLKRPVGRKQPKKSASFPPHEFLIEGFRVLAGRSNTQNDRLTLRQARGTDIWLHTKNIPGTHVIIELNGKTPPDSVIEKAAAIAAYYSKGGRGKIAVDYCPVKHVKKPAGAKPGMVVYEGYNTVYVTAGLPATAT